MIASLKPYPSYKDSGAPWLGKVPAQWEIVRLKRIARLAYGDSLTANERQESEIPVYGSNGLVGYHNRANTLAPVIIVGRKGSFGKIQYSAKPVFAIDTTFFIDKRSTEANLKWLFYMLSKLDLDRFSQDSAVPGLDRGEAYQKLTVLPPLPEQRAIVKFLDWAERRIRFIIAARKLRIQLLEEYRQVLINDAVTGKFDVRTGKPYPSYKGSGMPWLGKVPEGWKIRRLKSFVRNVNDLATESQHGQGLRLGLENVESWTGKIVSNSHEQPPFSGAGKEFCRDDILFGKLRPYLAKVVKAKESGICVSEFLVFRPIREVNPSYLEKLLRSPKFIDWVSGQTLGAKMPRAEWDLVGQVHLPLPPLPEQRAIAGYLDRETAKIDAAIEKTKESIALWEELRETLISDVVTGKLDVREVAERLPEEEPELEERLKALEASLLGGESEASGADSEPELEQAKETT